jgi:REP-associated tyrosine transposase
MTGRLPRATDDGLVFHACNRGNNRSPVLEDDADHLAFLEALGKTKERYPFRLFGYCLMTNHFHLLLRPESGQSISRILQSLTVTHTWRCHMRHRASGHVWQGRFKSPVIYEPTALFLQLATVFQSLSVKSCLMVNDLIR